MIYHSFYALNLSPRRGFCVALKFFEDLYYVQRVFVASIVCCFTYNS